MTQALDWNHTVFLGWIMSIRTSVAEVGLVGKLQFFSIAMLPLCYCYNMAEYFKHKHFIGTKTDTKKPP